jgi:glucose/arabinose dehydrogenase
LLGLAFHPNFATNGQFYISYTVGATGTRNTRVERYTSSSGVVDTGSRQTVLEFALPVSNNNHNGGWLGFSPVNNFLYISIGDGGPTPANSQNLSNLMGKMLRIDVNSVGANDTGGQYSIPAGNPFAGPTTGMAEIWSYGLRNPWRNSFDRANGNLWIGDVGQGTREEVNFQAAGSSAVANYGWNFREGTLGGTIPANNVDPIYEYDLGVSQAITGGYVYRGGNILDGGVSLDGTYFFADYQTNRIFSFRYNGSAITNFQERTSQLQTANLGTVQFLASFGEDALGRLYMLDLVGGEVFRIEGAAIPEPGVIATCSVLALGILWRWKVRRAAA